MSLWYEILLPRDRNTAKSRIWWCISRRWIIHGVHRDICQVWWWVDDKDVMFNRGCVTMERVRQWSLSDFLLVSRSKSLDWCRFYHKLSFVVNTNQFIKKILYISKIFYFIINIIIELFYFNYFGQQLNVESWEKLKIKTLTWYLKLL